MASCSELDRRPSRPETAALGLGIMDKIHALALPLFHWYRSRSSMQGDMFPASHPLPIHEPVFTPQQHPDPHVVEPWPRVGQIASAESKA